MSQVTQLLDASRRGDAQAMDQLFALLYQDLHQLAHSRLKRNGAVTLLDTTALVHESYLKFANAGELHINDRAHFFRYAGQVMRSVIVDLVRAAQAERRGGDAAHVTLNTAIQNSPDTGADEILRVHEALQELAQHDARLVQVVELRYFAGLTELEIAGVLGVTDRTVRRDWEKARLLLARALI